MIVRLQCVHRQTFRNIQLIGPTFLFIGEFSRDEIAMAHNQTNSNSKMKRKLYEKELQKLQVELCYLQDWVKATGAQIIIIFKGHDAAGKGGTIKATSEY
jgi:polyphosphate kinase 2 (PPK2 family)